MTGSFFDPASGADASAYSSANGGIYSPTFPAAGPGTDGVVRYGIDAHSHSHSHSGGGGGTTMPGSYFNPSDGPDASSYKGGRGTREKLFRDASGGPKKQHWLSEEALAAILREYKARSTVSARVSESAKALVRVIVEANAAAVLAEVRRKCANSSKRRASGSGSSSIKRSAATAAAISRETGKWVLQL
jgi:histone H3/H4